MISWMMLWRVCFLLWKDKTWGHAFCFPLPHCMPVWKKQSPVLHCATLHCTPLHCTALYCTVLHCTVLYCSVLYWTAIDCKMLYSSEICCRGYSIQYAIKRNWGITSHHLHIFPARVVIFVLSFYWFGTLGRVSLWFAMSVSLDVCPLMFTNS